MFLEPEETVFDLRFRVFGTHVRINIWFWVFSALLGWGAFNQGGMGLLALWIGCVFFSILLHEFGHVWMGRIFGSHGHIVLYSFGGLAVGSNNLQKRWQRICVLLAGPGIQLVLYLIVRGLALWFLPVINAEWQQAFANGMVFLLMINSFWPLLNLAPIWPLDGGQVCREVLVGAAGVRGSIASLWISIVTAGAVAVHAFLSERGQPFIPFLPPMGYYSAFFFAMMCVGSWQLLQAEQTRSRSWDDERLPWERR